MNRSKSLSLLTGLVLLAACDVRLGNDEETAKSSGNVSAAGKSEEGRFSISAPGFEMKMAIPDSIRAEAGIDDDNGLLYPNSRFSGIHVEGGREGGQGHSNGEVELRFTTADSPDAAARWYGDPARNVDFTVAASGREGADFVVSGTTKQDNGQFRVRLSPRSGGGTDGRLVLFDRAG